MKVINLKFFFFLNHLLLILIMMSIYLVTPTTLNKDYIHWYRLGGNIMQNDYILTVLMLLLDVSCLIKLGFVVLWISQTMSIMAPVTPRPDQSRTLPDARLIPLLLHLSQAHSPHYRGFLTKLIGSPHSRLTRLSFMYFSSYASLPEDY